MLFLKYGQSFKIYSDSDALMRRDSSVGIATGYGLDGPGIEFRWRGGTRFSAPLQIGPEAHPTAYTMGTGSFSGVRRPGCGVDHPPHLAPRLKKEKSYTAAPPYVPPWPVLGLTLPLPFTDALPTSISVSPFSLSSPLSLSLSLSHARTIS